MKLIGELKEKVQRAESKEEAREVIEAAGIELTDEELEDIAGGKGVPGRFRDFIYTYYGGPSDDESESSQGPIYSSIIH